MLSLSALYLLACLLVGFLGRKRQIGFAGFFVLSLFVTPLVMSLVYLLGAPQSSQT
jgi:uncharacterized membrane protein YhdT